MNNPKFLPDENIPLVNHYSKDRHNDYGNHDDDYDDYNTPNTCRVEETTFTTLCSSDK